MAKHPDWFAVRFEQPLEWATVHVPAESFDEWLLEITRLLTGTNLWHELLTVEASLVEQIRQRDWSKVSPHHLVHHLKLSQDMKRGAANFLPPPYDQWPLSVRQALYFLHFVLIGLAKINDNQDEDFGLPEVAKKMPPETRPVLAATIPLWNCLAEPAILAAISYHRSRHPEDFDAGLLKILMDFEAHAAWGAERKGTVAPLMASIATEAEAARWLAAFGDTPEAVRIRLCQVEGFQKHDTRFQSHEREGNVASEAITTLSEWLRGESGASALARALEGKLGAWPDEVKHGLDAAKPDLVTPSFVVRFGATPTWLLPNSEEADGETISPRTEQLQEILNNPRLPVEYRQLLELLLKKPNAKNIDLAAALGVAPATIGNWKKKLTTEYLAPLSKQNRSKSIT